MKHWKEIGAHTCCLSGQFESVEQALRWYNSEEYVPAKALRFKVAKNKAIVVQGL